MNAESEAEPSREELIALVAALRAHIAELERRLGLNSSNSGKPPSSDGLKKPARVSSLRERSGKKPGGQKGHKGETLRQVTDPNEVVNHYPPACSMCGVGLDPKTSVGHSARQVFDTEQVGLHYLSTALSVAAGEPLGHTDGRPVRCQSGHRHDRENEPGLRRTSSWFCRDGA
jgi:transposase